MSELHIDTDLGPDAAADLADAELQYLCGLALWELAVRTQEAEFAAYLESVMEIRRSREAELQHVRHDRDRLQFAAQVMADIRSLPGPHEPHEGPGLYL